LAGVAASLVVKASEQPDLAELSLAILAVRTFGIGKGVFRYGERLATHDAGLRSLSEIRAAVVDRLADIAPAGVPGWERACCSRRSPLPARRRSARSSRIGALAWPAPHCPTPRRWRH
jgi:hypothetical protein